MKFQLLTLLAATFSLLPHVTAISESDVQEICWRICAHEPIECPDGWVSEPFFCPLSQDLFYVAKD